MLHVEYRNPGPFTSLSTDQQRLVWELSDDPAGLCRAVQGLLVQPSSSLATDLDAVRLAERDLRPAWAILDAVLSRDSQPLDQPRATGDRVTGTCRHYAVLSTAFLRTRAIATRARCGFATYFQSGRAVDHWVTEYWDDHDLRWVRIDSEILDLDVIDNAHDLRDGQFLAGPEAWRQYRGGADPNTYGVHGTENWGLGEIIGNAIRDLASLNHMEMLPWDEWGPMNDCYAGNIAEWVPDLMDAFAAGSTDVETVAALYGRVPVPEQLVR